MRAGKKQDEDKHYYFGLNYNLSNSIHVRAKKNLERICKLTGLNKTQAYHLTMSLVNPEDIVGYLTSGSITVTEKSQGSVEKRETPEMKRMFDDKAGGVVAESVTKLSEKMQETTDEIEDMSESLGASVMNLFNQ